MGRKSAPEGSITIKNINGINYEYIKKNNKWILYDRIDEYKQRGPKIGSKYRITKVKKEKPIKVLPKLDNSVTNIKKKKPKILSNKKVDSNKMKYVVVSNKTRLYVSITTTDKEAIDKFNKLHNKI